MVILIVEVIAVITKFMTSSLHSVSGRPIIGMAKEIVYNVKEFFKKQKEEHKLNIDITAVTTEATRVSKRLQIL